MFSLGINDYLFFFIWNTVKWKTFHLQILLYDERKALVVSEKETNMYLAPYMNWSLIYHLFDQG